MQTRLSIVSISRLQNAARILAIIELTRRVLQAYEQAYDKEATGWLLPQDPRPKKEIVHIKEVPKKHTPSCVKHEWEVFKAKVEAVKAAAEEHFQERELPWLLKLLQAIASGIGGDDRIDPAESAADRFKDLVPDMINIAARDKEVEEGTQQAAKLRDQRIKENCKSHERKSCSCNDHIWGCCSANG